MLRHQFRGGIIVRRRNGATTSETIMEDKVHFVKFDSPIYSFKSSSAQAAAAIGMEWRRAQSRRRRLAHFLSGVTERVVWARTDDGNSREANYDDQAHHDAVFHRGRAVFLLQEGGNLCSTIPKGSRHLETPKSKKISAHSIWQWRRARSVCSG
jgi:hypothetical protein